MNENLKETLINLKESVHTSRREGEMRFIKIYISINVILIAISLLIRILTGTLHTIRIVPKITGYIIGIAIMSPFFFFQKKKTGSFTGINYFKKRKEMLIRNKKFEATNAFFALKYTLIDIKYEFDVFKIENFLEAILTKLKYDDNDFNNCLNVLNTNMYKQFKEELAINNHKEAIELNKIEERLREVVNEISELEKLEEKDLKTLC